MRIVSAVLSVALLSCAPRGGKDAWEPPAQKLASNPPVDKVDPAFLDAVAGAMPRVDALLQRERERAGFPSLVVGVVAGGKLVWSAGYGSRDGSEGGAAPDEETLYRLGSVTKVVTAMAVLRLRDAGLLDLDEPAVRYLPELADVVYPTKDSPHITIRHILTHTSGLPTMGPLALTGTTEAQLLGALKGLGVEFAPGSRTSYSNLAVALLGVIVARVTGETYRDFVERVITGPLKMTSAIFDGENAAPERLARGHTIGPEGLAPDDKQLLLGALEPSGGLYASLADTARLVAHHLQAEPPRSEPEAPPLSRATLREMQRVAGHSTGGGQTFGLGWVVLSEPGLGRIVFHNGSTNDYSASLWLLPDRGLALIAMSGSGASGALDKLTHAALLTLVEQLPVPQTPLAPGTKTAIERMMRLLEDPTEALVKETFTDAFLKAVPPEEVIVVTKTATVGKCTSFKPISVNSPLEAVVRVTCEKGAVDLYIKVQKDAPYKVDAAQFEAVPKP